MKEKRILDALERVDEKYIEDAAPGIRHARQSFPVRYALAAACVCLIAAGGFLLNRPGETPSVLPEQTADTVLNLPKITVPAYINSGMGYEALMYYSADELADGNPWREDSRPETLPVYKNGSYDPSGAGVPAGLSEAEMTERLYSAAGSLNLSVSDIETETDETKNEDGTIIPGTVYSIRGITDCGRLTVYADGSMVYELPRDYALPEGYSFTYRDTSDAEAEEVMAYLIETYAAFLDFEHPAAVLRGDYTYKGEYVRQYIVYDAGSTPAESILNYSFRTAMFAPDDSGNLMLIRVSDGLCKAEKIGDYPLITAAEAKEKLLNGQYQTSVPGGVPAESSVVKTEVVYRAGRLEETCLPYYRFWAELPDSLTGQVSAENGLKTYGAYYVPAVKDEYIAGLPVYDGSFN